MTGHEFATSDFEYEGRDLEAMDFAVNYHEWILDDFAPYLGDNVVEIGAGSGSLSELLVTRTRRLTCVEPSRAMFALHEQRFADRPQVAVHNAVLDGVAATVAAARPSAIVYVNVLEHIDDDFGELHRASVVLPSGSHLLVFVPALPWLMSRFDRRIGHRRRYTRRGLCEIVSAAGFRIVSVRYFDVLGIAPWFLKYTLARSTTMESRLVSVYDEYVVPVMRRLEGALSPPIGKNLILVARRP